MRRSDRLAELTALVAECAYCQEPQARLYRLPIVRPMGDLTDLAVCVFCYIRLAGVKPRREALLTAQV